LTAAIKLTLLMTLLINLIIPFGLLTVFSVTGIVAENILFLLKGIIIGGIIGLFESSMAKMRFFRLPSLFAMAFFFSTLTIIIEVFACSTRHSSRGSSGY